MKLFANCDNILTVSTFFTSLKLENLQRGSIFDYWIKCEKVRRSVDDISCCPPVFLLKETTSIRIQTKNVYKVVQLDVDLSIAFPVSYLNTLYTSIVSHPAFLAKVNEALTEHSV